MKIIKQLSLLLLSIVLILGVCGCMKKDKIDYRTQAYNYAKNSLSEKYSREFEIKDLERKDSGVFRTEEYIGIAYPTDSEKERFTIWVNPKEKTVVRPSTTVLSIFL